MMRINLYQPLIGIVRVCKFICWLLLTSGFSLHTSSVHGSEKQRLRFLDDRLAVIREALLTNDQKLRSLHESHPEVAALNMQFKLMSINAANRISRKWHKVLSLPVETHARGSTIYARSPEWRTMTKLTEMRYALSGVWTEAPKISIAKEETDTKKLHTLLKSIPYRVIPKLAETPDLSLLKNPDDYELLVMISPLDQLSEKGKSQPKDQETRINIWRSFKCKFLLIRREC